MENISCVPHKWSVQDFKKMIWSGMAESSQVLVARVNANSWVAQGDINLILGKKIPIVFTYYEHIGNSTYNLFNKLHTIFENET